jgi:pilus assembly protein CpaB
VITRAALDLRELPERYVEERHIQFDDLERVLGARATAALTSGSALLWSDLDVSQEGRTLSGLVRSGMRAFTLPERDVSFDGLLRPGDRVDVLFTPSAPMSATTTLLQSALVLTVGSDLGEEAPSDERRVGQVGRVTLSVTMQQAQLLAHSEQGGALRLALRNPQDLAVAEGSAPPAEIEARHGRPSRAEP